MAAACCFAGLRKEGVRVDVSMVAHAAELPVLRVKSAIRRLIRLLALQTRDLQLTHHDVHIRHFCTFFLQLAKMTQNSTLRKFALTNFMHRRSSPAVCA